MNKELKVMIYTAIGLLLILVVCNNIIHSKKQLYISEGTYASQTMALNRLRSPNIRRPSERGKYPSLKHKKGIKVIAVPQNNLLYVLDHRRVLYIAHALINFTPRALAVNDARGEKSFHMNNGQGSSAVAWTSIGQDGYLESPLKVNQHTVRGNWVKKKYRILNTIELSKKDAAWLQKLPQGTGIVIK
ncbi:hypothetical protein [[Lactobacillus] timonensis]|uniref:hypothetical protein n=1 Tax=[Lactobacillus] timonensis TaxID=1970790 RepID=UPI000C84FF82|nr:hypothetical protein [[Lactobacillus] timonensis]